MQVCRDISTESRERISLVSSAFGSIRFLSKPEKKPKNHSTHRCTESDMFESLTITCARMLEKGKNYPRDATLDDFLNPR